jgi:hypothetical protein
MPTLIDPSIESANRIVVVRLTGATLFGGDARGYTDYPDPALDTATA